MKSYLVFLIAIHGIAHAEEEYANCRYKEEMDDYMRYRFEEMHNGYRSLLALGKVYLNNSMSEKASKMMALKYDCDAENSAYISAKKCSTTPAPVNDYDENLYEVEDGEGDPVVEAINAWSSEALDFDQKAGNLYNDKIPSFANLVWDTHAKLGCAVVDCGRKKHVVCHYGPKEEREGKQIYAIGEPCSGCSDKNKCDPEEGLCYM
ncbi:hypothetical protein Aduo_014524 [Ancylostoma duodenale]